MGKNSNSAEQNPGESERFEALLEKLEEIVGQLESGERPLDESLKLYEQGVSTLRKCHGILDQAEKRIRLLVKGPDGEPELQESETGPRAVKPASGRQRTNVPRPAMRVSAEGAVDASPPPVAEKSDDQNIDSADERPQNPPAQVTSEDRPSDENIPQPPSGQTSEDNGGLLFGNAP